MYSQREIERAIGLLDDTERRQLARVVAGLPPTLLDWCKAVWPTWQWHWRHLVIIAEHLELVMARRLLRLIVEVPIRHGKSELVSTRMPVYSLHDDPTQNLILGSYNDTLATRFSRRARTFAERTGLRLNPDKQSANDWETYEGGGLRAVGVGAGITGRGGNGIIIDDPIKNREEAESETYRNKVWEWYESDLYSRLEPGGWLIAMAARWHFDDLIGRIVESEDGPNWTELKLPGLAEEDDPLGRMVGEALCPERYDAATLRHMRTVMGDYAFSGLVQQTPMPKTGTIFPRDKVEIIDTLPAGLTRRVRYWDKAATGGSGKYSAGVRMSYVPLGRTVGEGWFIVEDVVRGQWSADVRNRMMKQTARLDPPGTRQRVEQEPGSGGKESAEFTVKLLAGSTVDVDVVRGDKVLRAGPFSSQWQAGNVKLLRGPWNRDYLDEMAKAPLGRYLDQMDASSGAFNHLALVQRPGIRRLT